MAHLAAFGVATTTPRAFAAPDEAQPRDGAVVPPIAEGQARVAQALFEDGRALMEAGRFGEACPKLAESQRLDPGGGTLLNLALCYERLGAVATAWATYNAALSAAKGDRRGEREAFARARIAELAPRLPRLRFEITAEALAVAASVEIRVDDEVVPRAALDTTTPVDPGRHTVRASAPGRAPWTTTVTVDERVTETVRVPPLPASFPTMAAPNAAAGPRGGAFWVLGGVSVAGLGAGAVTGVLALTAHASAESKCIPSRSFCPDATSADDASRARTFAWISTGALAGGIVAGALAWLLPRSKGAVTAGAPRVNVAVAPTVGGATVGVDVVVP